jgi:hypothetical protein
MNKLVYEGTVRTVENLERHKKDQDTDRGKLVIRNTDDLNVIIQGARGLTDGFNPDDPVKITIERTQSTLKEATKGEK